MEEHIWELKLILQISFLSHSKSFRLVYSQNQKLDAIVLSHNLQLGLVTVLISGKESNPWNTDVHHAMNIKDLTLKGMFKFLMEVHLLMNAIMLPEVTIRTLCSLKQPDMLVEQTRKSKKSKRSVKLSLSQAPSSNQCPQLFLTHLNSLNAMKNFRNRILKAGRKKVETIHLNHSLSKRRNRDSGKLWQILYGD